MGNGFALHIGLNKVSRDRYYSSHELLAPENDAKAMQRITAALGFKTKLLLTEEALAGNVIAYVSQKASELVSGDYLIITFSGHGKYIPDYSKSKDEKDGLDETWLMYDRMLIDDEIYLLLSKFAKGVRVLFISDSCHSGTVIKLASDLSVATPAVKTIPEEAAMQAFEKSFSEYLSVKFLASDKNRPAPVASIELLAACQDDQKAYDGEPYSYFTEHLLKIWQDGNFSGSLPEFFLQIKQSMNGFRGQIPERLSLGHSHPKFTNGNPFAI